MEHQYSIYQFGAWAENLKLNSSSWLRHKKIRAKNSNHRNEHHFKDLADSLLSAQKCFVVQVIKFAQKEETGDNSEVAQS